MDEWLNAAFAAAPELGLDAAARELQGAQQSLRALQETLAPAVAAAAGGDDEPQDMRIVELMRAPLHDLPWLKQALQAAIKLEFATLPPYLCARWSVKSGNDPVARSIRAIVMEEMFHMGLACNLLTAIGGAPVLNTPAEVPEYPGPLPGGVHPGLEVGLEGLSVSSAAVFMTIEYPQGGPIALRHIEEYPTIGDFYDAIEAAFVDLNPPLTLDGQLEGPLGLTKILAIRDVLQAIAIIKRQGEGSALSPEDTGPDDLRITIALGRSTTGVSLGAMPFRGLGAIQVIRSQCPQPGRWARSPWRISGGRCHARHLAPAQTV